MSSFFGGHGAFASAHNPFAGLSNRDKNAEALDFEDTYDGLGDQLEEDGDDFNDDTFGGSGDGGAGGGGGGGGGNVGKDFDFFGQTARVSTAIEEEQLRYQRQMPAPRTAKPADAQAPPAPLSLQNTAHSVLPRKPARTGYEKYKDDELQVDAALWGVAPKKSPTHVPPPQPSPSVIAPTGRKVMSLEEVEAQIRAQAQQNMPQPAPPSQASQPQALQQVSTDAAYQQPHPSQTQASIQMGTARAAEAPSHAGPGLGPGQPVTILQRRQPPKPKTTSAQHNVPPPPQQPSPAAAPTPLPVQPKQILQNPNRMSGDAAKMGPALGSTPPASAFPPQPHHRPQGSFSRAAQIITHPSQLSQLSDEEKAAYMNQEARRAKRNHKIYLMSRENGIMTPQDKNFVTRIQLQQLVAATGNPNDHGTDEALAEDFYYQVYTQIKGGQRQHPGQPLSNFAQTYLFQTGGRQGGMRRHYARGPENHMQRMEQQVQRAVEAAKNKPKNKQLVIEGSLGKISFSNAKTPKPLLNIKRTDSAADANRPSSAHRGPQPSAGVGGKSELRSIENMYAYLMEMEDHERVKPPPPPEGDVESQERLMMWEQMAQRINQKLWAALRVHDFAPDGRLHPFIALLSYGKGMKAMPRVYRSTTIQQRTTILTLITVNMDNLDVVRDAQVTTVSESRLNAAMRDKIEEFSLSVMPTLFNVLNELELDLVAGIFSLICTRNIGLIAKSRVGASMLTMILSRAELIKNIAGEQPKNSWGASYNQFFDAVEPALPHIFPGAPISGEDFYVWQLLAAIGIGASPEQQQRLVLAVKDRVMDTITLSKTLPPDMEQQRLQSVNLFMRSIGLDVELLQ